MELPGIMRPARPVSLNLNVRGLGQSVTLAIRDAAPASHLVSPRSDRPSVECTQLDLCQGLGPAADGRVVSAWPLRALRAAHKSIRVGTDNVFATQLAVHLGRCRR